MNIGLFYNDFQKAGGINTYFKLLLDSLPIAFTDSHLYFIMPDATDKQRSFEPNLQIPDSWNYVTTSEIEDHPIILDAVFTSAAGNYQYDFLGQLDALKCPIIGIITSWSDVRKAARDRRTYSLPQCNTYISWFGPARVDKIREKYEISDSDTLLYHYHTYELNYSPVGSGFVAAGRHIGNKELSVIQSIQGRGFPITMRFENLGSGYRPEEATEIMGSHSHFILPHMGKWPEHDGSPDWVILEAIASNTLPVVYKPTADLFINGRYGIKVATFDADGTIDYPAGEDPEESIRSNRQWLGRRSEDDMLDVFKLAVASVL